MKFLLAKTLGGQLAPVDEAGTDALRKLKRGETVQVELRRPRNPQFHRKLFAMLNIILNNQEHYKSVEDLLAVAKLSIGHAHVIQTKYGDIRLPASISFAALDEDSFSVLYDRICGWVCTDVIPGLERQGLDEAVAEELRGFGTPEGA